jgi:hypothetical protein
MVIARRVRQQYVFTPIALDRKWRLSLRTIVMASINAPTVSRKLSRENYIVPRGSAHVNLQSVVVGVCLHPLSWTISDKRSLRRLPCSTERGTDEAAFHGAADRRRVPGIYPQPRVTPRSRYWPGRSTPTSGLSYWLKAHGCHLDSRKNIRNRHQRPSSGFPSITWLVEPRFVLVA